MSVDVTSDSGTSSGKSNVELARDIGLIGLLWASMGSIIGSGWLFGAQKGLFNAGPAVLISWVIGGLCILILALVHAELGAMFPALGRLRSLPALCLRRHRRSGVRLVLLDPGRDGRADRGVRRDPLRDALQLGQRLAPPRRDPHPHRARRRHPPDGAARLGQLPRRQGARQHQHRAHVVEGRRAPGHDLGGGALRQRRHTGPTSTPQTGSTPTASRASCSRSR